MLVSSWTLSARIAWNDMTMRVMAIIVLCTVFIASFWFLVTILPGAITHQAVAIHYTIYNGIDAVKHWPWIVGLVGMWLSITVVDILAAFGIYRTDLVMARTLVFLAGIWCLPWIALLFYLSLMNV